jgi:hypothetical protein
MNFQHKYSNKWSEIMNDFLQNIGEKHPDLKRYLQGLKPSPRSDYQDYEAAKRYMRTFHLPPDEDGECLRYICERLKL